MTDGDKIAVTFQVNCTETRLGDAVFIVGSSKALGDWQPSGALPCTTAPNDFPTWSSETGFVTVTAGSTIEFKVLVMAADGSKPSEARWEPGANRELTLPQTAGSLVVTCAWGDPEVACCVGSKVGSKDSSCASTRSSEHLCMDSNAKLSTETPSLTPIDENQLADDSKVAKIPGVGENCKKLVLDLKEFAERARMNPTWLLYACLLVDAIGFASYLIIILGEFTDLIWAPISGLLLQFMFGSMIMSTVGFLEEYLPFTDILPTASITWALAYLDHPLVAILRKLLGVQRFESQSPASSATLLFDPLRKNE